MKSTTAAKMIQPLASGSDRRAAGVLPAVAAMAVSSISVAVTQSLVVVGEPASPEAGEAPPPPAGAGWRP
jgi:hypothetical protein